MAMTFPAKRSMISCGSAMFPDRVQYTCEYRVSTCRPDHLSHLGPHLQ
jgi:hypothetical protein